ncbi:hypothetical protein ACFVT5_02020 [Streptomyces sp. NPDC058001]|uniref:hypothetical protein n=1 Tax=Streptomyces sp. NPDC058001 TaxID=3346300 RepID=UPI0036E414FC
MPACAAPTPLSPTTIAHTLTLAGPEADSDELPTYVTCELDPHDTAQNHAAHLLFLPGDTEGKAVWLLWNREHTLTEIKDACLECDQGEEDEICTLYANHPHGHAWRSTRGY